MTEHPSCYGDMFPDIRSIQRNVPAKGKAFTVLIESAGISVRSAEVEVDKSAWDACQECPSYRSCYDLSMAKLLLMHALDGL